MVANQMNSEVVFDIADVWFNWWHWWPFSILMLGIVALTTVCYAVFESLPDQPRKCLQRAALLIGALGAAAVLSVAGLFTINEWLSFRTLLQQRQHAELKMVEGELVPIIRYITGNWSPNEAGGRGDPTSFKIVDADNKEHAFAWRLGGGVSLEDVLEQDRRNRLRVQFVPNLTQAHNKYRVEKALTIERLVPESK
jgi:hypothetical protein